MQPPVYQLSLYRSERGTQWVTKHELENILVESLTDEQYDYFVRTMMRVMDHPYSLEAQEFLMRYRRSQVSNLAEQDIVPLSHDEEGNPYVEARGKSLHLFFYIGQMQS